MRAALIGCLCSAEGRCGRRAERLGNGVPMAQELIVQLDRLAAKLGLAPVRER
jgi:hypothetical protein